MNIRKEKINITPDRALFPKLGQTGYSVAEALAELIDNSIDARDENVIIKIRLDPEKKTIEVEDNGRGMGKKEAAESIVLGRSNKKIGDLGQFGIGLKTACMSLGQKFTIETTSKDNDELYILTFDENEFVKSGSWSNFEIQIKKGISREQSGTKIIIDKLKIKFYSTLINAVEKHLSQRFTPFLKNREATILINEKILSPDHIKIISGSKKDFTIILSNKSNITGWTGILEIGSVERSGFNLYRFSRLIRAHEKLGYLYHPSKMWITGEVHLNPIPVTHNKREFITEHPLYIEFFDKFQEILKPVLAQAQKHHQEERIKDLPKELKETLKDNVMKALNKVDDFKELAFPSLTERGNRSEDGSILDDQEVREKRENKNITEEEIPNMHHIRSPIKKRENKVRYITIAGKRYRFDYDWKPLDENIAKEAYLDKETGTIMVVLNSKYHMLNVIKPDIFYHAIYLIEGIVQVFLKENNQPIDRLIELRDKLAKQLADVISEDAEIKITSKEDQVIAAQSFLLKNKGSKNNRLTNNEKNVLSLRMEKGLTPQLISEKLKVSRQRIYQILDSAMKKISGIRIKSETNLKETWNQVVELSGNKDVDSIIYNIAQSYDISPKKLLGKSRKANLVLPRHLVMYLLKEKLNLSFPKIAKIMGKNDHSTIMHAYKKINKLIEESKISIVEKN